MISNELMLELKTKLSNLGYNVDDCKITRDFLDAGVPYSTLMHSAGGADNCKSMGLRIGSSMLLNQPRTNNNDALRIMFDDLMFKIASTHVLDIAHPGKILLEMYIDADRHSVVACIDVVAVVNDFRRMI